MKKQYTPTSYRRAALDGRFDAIVAGSGAGGLAAAVLLAKHAGKRVLVLERHYTAGGFTHVFRRTGFEWDVGLHYIGDVQDPDSETRRIFDHLTDARLQWAAMPDIYDRVIMPERSFDFPSGVERFRERMHSYFPQEARAIDRYISAVNSTAARMRLFFAEKALPPFLQSVLGAALRYPYLRYARWTTAHFLRELTNDPYLVGVLTAQWGDYGLPPGQSSFGIHAIIARHYFDGDSYPIGGAGAILSSMAPIIESRGGSVVVNAEIDSIIVENDCARGVRMADGIEIRAPVVISNVGARNTYSRLLRAKSPPLDRMRQALSAIPPSISHLCLYVGLEGTTSELNLEGTNLWIYPGADHDASLQSFFLNPEAEFPGVYISFPSAKDPSFNDRFPGRSTIDVITWVPYDWFTRWEETQWRKRGEDYETFKDSFQTRLLEVLYRHVPRTKGHVIHAELSTPLTTRHFTDHARGEIYGLAHTPERFQLRALGTRTPIRGLYVSGQDAAVCGVAGAIAGGILAASAVLGRNMFRVVTKKTNVAVG
jgi:all-trans-retinol 13,14-reductase